MQYTTTTMSTLLWEHAGSTSTRPWSMSTYYLCHKCRYDIRTDQTFISLTRFAENISNIYISKFIIKIDSMVYLRILIMYDKY